MKKLMIVAAALSVMILTTSVVLAQEVVFTGEKAPLPVYQTIPTDESAEPEEERKPVRVRRTYSINLSDGKVRKRLIALAVIFALMLLFDIGYLFLDRSAAGLPGRTESVQKETAEVLAENEELQQTADNLGDYEQLKELRDSWQRLKEQIEE